MTLLSTQCKLWLTLKRITLIFVVDWNRHFVINLPGSWECRHTVQNILRIAWMDVFEHAGWTILSMWNSTSSAAEPLPQLTGTFSEDPSSDGGGAGSSAASATETASAGATAADSAEFKGECANFLLFKRASTGALLPLDPHYPCACPVVAPPDNSVPHGRTPRR